MKGLIISSTYFAPPKKHFLTKTLWHDARRSGVRVTGKKLAKKNKPKKQAKKTSEKKNLEVNCMTRHYTRDVPAKFCGLGQLKGIHEHLMW